MTSDMTPIAFGLAANNPDDKTIKMDFYPMLIEFMGEDKEEVIRSFQEEMRKFLLFVKGHKYWRRIPEISREIHYDTNTVSYKVRARMYATFEPFPKAGPEINEKEVLKHIKYLHEAKL